MRKDILGLTVGVFFFISCSQNSEPTPSKLADKNVILSTSNSTVVQPLKTPQPTIVKARVKASIPEHIRRSHIESVPKY